MKKQRKWVTELTVGKLLSIQLQFNHGEPTEIVNTLIGAYKQFSDIEMLLYLLETYKVKLNEDDVEHVAKIRSRHEKYRAAQLGDDDDNARVSQGREGVREAPQEQQLEAPVAQSGAPVRRRKR